MRQSLLLIIALALSSLKAHATPGSPTTTTNSRPPIADADDPDGDDDLDTTPDDDDDDDEQTPAADAQELGCSASGIGGTGAVAGGLVVGFALFARRRRRT